MNIYKTLLIPSNKNFSDRTVSFGVATTDEEKESSYRLRYKVYKERGYIDASRYEEPIEKDSFDEPGKSTTFIATVDGKTIGCIRLITTTPLPTESYFSFEEPDTIKHITKERRGELGRFVIIPPDKDKKDFLPRGLVMLFIIDTLAQYGLNHSIDGGYAFIKKNLEHKLTRAGMPFGHIAIYNQHYPKDGILAPYFSQTENPVIPVYFQTALFAAYTRKKLSNRFIFKLIGQNTFRLRSSILVTILRKLRIL